MRQVQCPRCGYVFSAPEQSANACPNCGLPTLAPDSTTPTITMPPVGASSASAWGQPTPTASAPAPTSSPYPPSDAPTSVPSWGATPYSAPSYDPSPAVGYSMPSPAGSVPIGGSPSAPHASSGRSPRLLAIIAAAVALVVILGVVGALAAGIGSKNATAKPTATARVTTRSTVPALPKGYTLYTDRSGLYAIGYPGDWSTTPVDDARYSIIEFSQSNLGATVEIERVSLSGVTLNPATAQPYLSNVFKGFAQALSNGNAGGNMSAVSAMTLAGSAWFEASGDVTYTAGDSQMTARLVVDMTARSGSAVLMARFASLASDYDTLNTRYFTPMLATFRFLR